MPAEADSGGQSQDMKILSIAVLLGAAAALSFPPSMNPNKPITIKGTVTKVEWMNPHIWFYLESKDDSGKVATWQCEGGPPNSLTRQGWTRCSLKPGDQITVEGFRAKDGTNTCNSRSVKFPDGKSVFSGTADDGAPGRRGEAKPE